jgi:hypothetical protein
VARLLVCDGTRPRAIVAAAADNGDSEHQDGGATHSQIIRS